jgi:RNA 3'-terminal phosphate cyclase (ATP)
MASPIEIDGAEGEGGGQVLRTALSLSLITGTPFRIARLRGGRDKPGLRRQHLVAVQAAQEIGAAVVEGAALGSRELSSTPGPVTHGERRFGIGSAGSTALVLQTLVWPLLLREGRSRLVLEGGTHAPLAPTADSLLDAFLPALGRLGLGDRIELSLVRCGFMPAGGGRLELVVRGGAPLRALSARALVSQLAKDVAVRELELLRHRLGIEAAMGSAQLRIVEVDSAGPGNALQVVVEHEDAVEAFQAIGERGVRAEAVAERLAREVQAHLDVDAPVGPHLADQLLIPLALAGSGSFSTTALTEHTRTNARLIERFLPVELRLEDQPSKGTRVCAVTSP